MKNIKIIRLATGEDVIGDIEVTDTEVKVKKSFVLIPRQQAPGQPVQLMLSPWQPYTDDAEITVDKSKVITMIILKKILQITILKILQVLLQQHHHNQNL